MYGEIPGEQQRAAINIKWGLGGLCRAAGWVAQGAGCTVVLVPWGPLEQQQRWEWLWALWMDSRLELKERKLGSQ